MPQERKGELPAGHVLPKDPVKVYSTSLDPHHADGEEMNVHRALAEKLVAAGKATYDKPKPATKADKKD